MHFSLATILAIVPLVTFASPLAEQPHITSFTRRADADQLGHSHQYIPSKATDSRSPCPAVNALANHGYL
jgi:Peroxidase, family 2